MPSHEPFERVGAKWTASGAGSRYGDTRFASARAAGRDLVLVSRLLERCGEVDSVLDAPCGAGRLQAMLAGRVRCVTGADVSAQMLAAVAAAARARCVRASVAALPFRDCEFDAVVCCRFLHHLHGREALERAVAELVRVSRRFVIASFWDSASWPAMRVRLGLKRSEGPLGRAATSRASIARAFELAGARVVAHEASLRFVSQQTFVLAERVGSGG